MIYILNKNKIYSYVIALFVVLSLFAFGSSIIPKDDVELLQVSANTTNNIENDINTEK